MSDYISREEVKRLVCEICGECDGVDVCELRDIKVDAIPAADVQEVKQGKWLLQKIPFKGGHGQTNTKYKCTVCRGYNKSKTPFCPNCGADMREEQT